MGIDGEELADYYQSIVDFSELAAVMDRPVKTYSTGMVVRLAFSLVTAVRPEILIIDEALAVGDRAFQRKCIARMMDIQRAGTAILFCSHNMHQVVQFCQRVAWLEHGRVKALGEADEIVDRYVAQDLSAVQGGQRQRPSPAPVEERRCIVEAVSPWPAGPDIRRGDSLSVEIDFKVLQAGEFAFGLAIDRKGSDVRLVAETSQENGLPPVFLEPGSYQVYLRMYTDLLRAGSYQVYAGLMDRSLMQIEDYRTFDLEVADPDGIRSPAVVRARVDWDTEGTFFS
jgi:energy-coupling factor transporter ATP-binding protein EcfA2